MVTFREFISLKKNSQIFENKMVLRDSTHLFWFPLQGRVEYLVKWKGWSNK